MRCSTLRYYLAINVLVMLWLSMGYSAEFNLELNTGASYSDNVFRSETIAQDDAYFTVAPKATLEMPLNRAYTSLALRGVLEQHIVETSANLQEVILNGLGRYNLSDHTSLGIRDEITVTGRLQAVEKLSDVTRRREFTDNRFVASAKYDLKGGDLATSLEYANTIRNYRGTEVDDWVTNTGRLRIEYILGNKTSTSAEFKLSRKIYQAGINYISFPVSASLKRQLSSKFKAALSLGMEKRGYNEVLGELGWNEPMVSLSVTGKLAPKTESKLILMRRVHDSDFMTGYAFVSTAADTSIVLRLRDTIQLTLHGLYSKNDYMQRERKDNYFSGRIEVRRIFSRWGSVFISYGYEIRNSNIQRDGYKQHSFELYHVTVF